MMEHQRQKKRPPVNPLWKRLRTNVRFQRFAARLLKSYIDFVYRTSRWTYEGFEEQHRRFAHGERFFFAFWHNRIAMMPYSWDRALTPASIVLSDHRDADILVRALNAYGMTDVRVPTSKPKFGAFRPITKRLQAGDSVALCPDGPLGPAFCVKRGSIELVRLCGSRISLITYSVRWRIVLPSWDRFVIPLPFNSGIFVWRPGIEVPRSTSREEIEDLRATTEQALRELADYADCQMGHRASLIPGERRGAAPGCRAS